MSRSKIRKLTPHHHPFASIGCETMTKLVSAFFCVIQNFCFTASHVAGGLHGVMASGKYHVHLLSCPQHHAAPRIYPNRRVVASTQESLSMLQVARAPLVDPRCCSMLDRLLPSTSKVESGLMNLLLAVTQSRYDSFKYLFPKCFNVNHTSYTFKTFTRCRKYIILHHTMLCCAALARLARSQQPILPPTTAMGSEAGISWGFH